MVFLEKIASVYYQYHAAELADVIFVFPNRRAGVFFQHYLKKMVDKPVFAPEAITVDELFSRLSSLQTADKTGLLFRLYSIYCKINDKAESFDHFVYWGEMLINDFDDVDKYLVDAKQLFTNVTELKEIDTLFGYLNENQIEAIRRFWSTFEPMQESSKQKDFRATWEVLYPLYETLRNELLQQNEGYQGMIFRDVAERIKNHESLDIEGKQIVFVGFNALTPAERALFRFFKYRGIADFYWDYDIPELKDRVNRGSDFIQENLLEFPSRYTLESDEPEERKISLAGIPSAVGQAKYVSRLLRDNYSCQDGEQPDDTLMQTVVLLPDENLLLPVVNSLPECVSTVNVTMGYPVAISSAAVFIDQLLLLQRNARVNGDNTLFYYRSVQQILHHPYLLFLMNDTVNELSQQILRYNKVFIDKQDLAENELLDAMFTFCRTPKETMAYLVAVVKLLLQAMQPAEDEPVERQMEQELLFSLYGMLNRAQGLFDQFAVEMTTETFRRLLKQLMDGLILPFEGEPLSGLQIMGLLETRALDFANVIVLSFNEGVFPTKQSALSFIPYHLRRGFGLPTGEHQDAVFAYHFYRLLHRAKTVHLLYDTRSDGMQSGEVSRYLYQLRYHYRLPIREAVASFSVTPRKSARIEVAKEGIIAEKLAKYIMPHEGKALSASSLNTYLECPLHFYFTTIEGLNEEKEVEETIEANTFGLLFHETMQELYKPFVGQMVTATAIDGVLKNVSAIDELIALKYTRLYLQKDTGIVHPEGQHLILATVIRHYVMQLLRHDRAYAPFEYVASEKAFHVSMPLSDGKRKVNLKGFIDRIDRKEGVLRILDYKSGSDQTTFSSIEKLFHTESVSKRSKAVFQVFFYAMAYLLQQNDATVVEPGIVLLSSLFKSDFVTHITRKENRQQKIVSDFATIQEEFASSLTQVLDEIFNPDIPFRQTDDPARCTYCPFTVICRKENEPIDSE
ncbi:PD-(D/E)XK nuclease family protein [Microbacter margulisiae]|uniref:CRISPR/Cas system-associated exonuclease Cas4 (RecB family) n=1 Tax=Microbacter margulisiae TaxID=1350067 RepID=A0A7W5DR26_9PORP|nr:PD-(D/E)XK nuclease family protein [Microbacter margulisiae]MBB3187525.1 CRISPR/Cas system-associated exonuclease Cas4 (RecB family) [Microbacter margulisiae]